MAEGRNCSALSTLPFGHVRFLHSFRHATVTRLLTHHDLCVRGGGGYGVRNIYRGDSTKGGDGVTDEGTFSCVCAKKCSYWKSAKALRCAEVRTSLPPVSNLMMRSVPCQEHQFSCLTYLLLQGWEMLGNPYTSQFDSANLKQSQGENGIVRDNSKKEECACVCGNAADGKWYTVA